MAELVDAQSLNMKFERSTNKMINTTQKYIDVLPTLTTKRGIWQVILNYYDNNNERHQPWKSLGIEDKPRK